MLEYRMPRATPKAKSKPKPKLQRRYVTNAVYEVTGIAKGERSLKFVGRMNIRLTNKTQEYLVFRLQRETSKTSIRNPKT